MNGFKRKPGHVKVLDVGCRDNPFPNANVLCDVALPQKLHEIRKREPFIKCDIQFLPFKDKSFYFVYCAHVLEHVDRPRKAFAELRRVGRHGYVETPSWFSEEILYGWAPHRWSLTKRGREILFRPKKTGLRFMPFGYITHRLFEKFILWKSFHLFLDECFNLIYIRYYF